MASVRFESLEEAQAKTTSEAAKWRLEKEHLAREYCIAVEEVKIMQEKLRECYIKEGVNYKVGPPPPRPRRQLPTFVATTIDPVAAAAPHLRAGAGTFAATVPKTLTLTPTLPLTPTAILSAQA
jgi:hypothetical protein